MRIKWFYFNYYANFVEETLSFLPSFKYRICVSRAVPLNPCRMNTVSSCGRKLENVFGFRTSTYRPSGIFLFNGDQNELGFCLNGLLNLNWAKMKSFKFFNWILSINECTPFRKIFKINFAFMVRWAVVFSFFQRKIRIVTMAIKMRGTHNSTQHSS